MTQQSPDVAAITKGYTFAGESLELGVLVDDGTPVPEAKIRISMSMLNRHGLVAGATGTGKTKTLQLMAEQISNAGVSVFAADIKGDLSGLALPGTPSEKLMARTQAIGQQWAPQGSPVEFFSLGGVGTGVPLRATVSSFGPILLSKVLGLNETQESSLGLVFHFADQNQLWLDDLPDLRHLLQHLTSDEGKAALKQLGGLSSATVGVILRSLITLETQGGGEFFGLPQFDTRDLIRTTPDGRGVISLLELPNLQDRPAIFSTFLMWLLADLFHDLPEVGDVDVPKLVFFFDEAHLLFDGASKAFLDAIAQTVRLIRSKGVGVFFVTQVPADVPDTVLAQLGSRVQHQLRAHTPNDAKALKQAVNTYPTSSYDLAATLQTLGIGEAVVTVLNPNGAPTPVAWTRMRAPQSLMGPMETQMMAGGVALSSLMTKYGQDQNRDSAHEMLTRQEQAASQAAAQQAQQAQYYQQQAQQQAEYERQQAKLQAQYQRQQAPAQRQPQRTTATSRSRQPMSPVEKVLSSPTFWNRVIGVGGQIARGMMGTSRR